MRIALVGLTHPFRGGIAHYTTLLCRHMRRRHEVGFFSMTRQYPELLFPGRTQKDASASAMTVANQPCLDSMDPLSWFHTASLIHRFRPDMLLFSWWHPFFAPSFGTVAHLARLRGVPSCFLCHNVLPHERSRVDRALLAYGYASTAAFIVHSKEDAADARRLRPGVPVHENPHPSYDEFAADQMVPQEEARARLGIRASKVILFFGFIRKYKGLNHLLEAMLQLPPEDGVHLLVVGEFYEDREVYADALGKLEARGQVTLVDRYVANEEVPLFYAAADLVMVPYLSATQSGIVQIAYGLGRPVVVTRVGGLPEVVDEGKTGYVVPPADAGALADAIRRFYRDRETVPFAEHIERENARFDWERMVETVEAVAAELGLGSGGHGTR